MRRSVYMGCRARKRPQLQLVGDRLIDLSPQGMLLLSDEAIDLGTELFVSFMATDLPIWFDTRATVARVVEGRRTGDPGRAFGVRFHTLPSVARLILRGHLRKAPTLAPRRMLPVELRSAQERDYAQIVKDIWAGA